MNTMRLQGKTALVTGGDQGIGKAIVLRFAQEGAAVAIDYRNDPTNAQKTLLEVEAAGGKGMIVQGDVSVVADTRRLIAETVEHFGHLDILVNNAGIEKRAPFWDVTEEDYHAVIAVNQTGPFFVTQSFVRYLLSAKRKGKIVNMSSVHEDLPFPHFTAYCMSKGAMRMMTRNLAVELGPLGINVNNIAPGAIETPINAKLLNDPAALQALLGNIPMGRLGNTDDVASLAVFLASPESDYVTASTFVVDGGLLWNYSEQ